MFVDTRGTSWENFHSLSHIGLRGKFVHIETMAQASHGKFVRADDTNLVQASLLSTQ